MGARQRGKHVDKTAPQGRCCDRTAVEQELGPWSQVLPPAGNGIGTQQQGVAGDPLPRHQQAARFAVTDQANDRSTRIGP